MKSTLIGSTQVVNQRMRKKLIGKELLILSIREIFLYNNNPKMLSSIPANLSTKSRGPYHHKSLVMKRKARKRMTF